MTSHLQTAVDTGYSLTGICLLLSADRSEDTIDLLQLANARTFIVKECRAQGWYSGNPQYPIAHPDIDGIDEVDAYYHTEDNLFDSNTEYGRRRIHLAKLILKEFYHD